MAAGIIGVAGVLLRPSNKNGREVLLVEENKDDPQVEKVRGMLGLCMGHVHIEMEETPQQAMEREFLEETGIRVEYTRFLGIFSVGVEQIPVYAFRVEAVNGDFQENPPELTTHWMDAQKVLNLSEKQVRPPTKAVLQQALQQP